MQSILFLLVIFLANIIQGITGFAGTVLAMPFSIMLLGIDTAKPLLNIITLVACLIIVIESYKNIVWPEFIKMTLIMLVGVFIGEYIYTLFPIDVLLTIYAVFIIVLALKGLFFKKEFNINDTVLIGIIIAAGMIHGMFISGGPLLIIYAAKKLPDKAQFRATLSPVWMILSTYLLIKQVILGLITAPIITLSLVSIPVLIIAIIIGKILYTRMSQETFMKISYILLLISGISLLL